VKSLIEPLSRSSDEMNRSCLSMTFIYTYTADNNLKD